MFLGAQEVSQALGCDNPLVISSALAFRAVWGDDQAKGISSLNIPFLLWETEAGQVHLSHTPIYLLAEPRSPGTRFPLQTPKDSPGPKANQGSRLGMCERLWGGGSQKKEPTTRSGSSGEDRAQ